MSKRNKDAQIDQILARGHLGGPRYDDVLRRVLEETAPRPSRVKRILFPGLVLAVGLGAWLVVARMPEDDRFTPKGPSGGVAADVIEIGCASSRGLTCRPGDTLMFKVNAAVVSGYLGAYAERSGAAPGERIWYFPSADGTSLRVAPGGGTVVLPHGISIGPEHQPGTYRVTVWLSPRPLTRADVDRAGEDALEGRATFDVQVLSGTE